MLSPNQTPGVLKNLIASYFDSLCCEPGIERNLFMNEQVQSVCERLAAYDAHDEVWSTWTTLEDTITRFMSEFSPCWEELSFIGNETRVSLVSKFQPIFVEAFHLTREQAEEIVEFLYRNNLLSVPV